MPESTFLIELSKIVNPTKKDYFSIQRKVVRRYGVAFFNKDKLNEIYHKLVQNNILLKNSNLENLLRLKNTRSLSGIVVVSVLTKPYDCPGNCLYCPTQKNVPKSYIKDEPAVMRAIMCNYDPYKQVVSRLKALNATGHITDKINIRIIGGTWSHYNKIYQTWFMKMCFLACNGQTKAEGNKKKLVELQIKNEKAKNRIVEISIETRQDHIDKNEIIRLRRLGVTKVELGVQSIYDDVLKINNRGNDNTATIMATRLLKDAGFKISYQVMPNLMGSDLKKDETMFKTIFSDQNYQPDFIKIYPLALLKEANIYSNYLNNRYKPYSKEELTKLLKNIKTSLPYYVRVERVIRDIPSNYIVEGGAKISNLRQIVQNEMEKENLRCKCIRCREVKGVNSKEKIFLFREDYDASYGKEIFLSFENKKRTRLYSLLRLRITSQYYSGEKNPISILNDSSIIREIHTYGPQIEIGERDKSASQHKGLGKRLMLEAEKISRNEFKLKNIAVISGVGVREYFKKLGYKLINTYMVKKL